MPTSGIELYQMQDARNNFDAMRPAPICADANQFMGQCQNVHISMNCYYGYHDQKGVENDHVVTDCEMVEVADAHRPEASASPQSNARKRSAEQDDCPMTKRFREAAEVQIEKTIEPETNERLRMDSRTEDLIETLYWNTHGGNMFHLLQCGVEDLIILLSFRMILPCAALLARGQARAIPLPPSM